jgi:hypothetical protein
MNAEDIDLQTLAEELEQKLRHYPVHGYLRGKSLMRDVLLQEHRFSALEAEELVDTLEMNGYLHFLGDPSERSHASDTTWEIEPKVP